MVANGHNTFVELNSFNDDTFQLVVELMSMSKSEGARAAPNHSSQLIVASINSEISFHFCNNCRIFSEGVKVSNNGIMAFGRIMAFGHNCNDVGPTKLIVKFIGLVGPIDIIGQIFLVGFVDLVGIVGRNGYVGHIGLSSIDGIRGLNDCAIKNLVGLSASFTNRHISLVGLDSIVGLIGFIDLGLIVSIIGLIGLVGLDGIVGLVSLLTLADCWIIDLISPNSLVGFIYFVDLISLSGIGGISGFGGLSLVGLVDLVGLASRNSLIYFIGLDGLIGVISISGLGGIIGIANHNGLVGRTDLIGLNELVELIDYVHHINDFLGPLQLIVICNWWTNGVLSLVRLVDLVGLVSRNSPINFEGLVSFIGLGLVGFIGLSLTGLSGLSDISGLIGQISLIDLSALSNHWPISLSLIGVIGLCLIGLISLGVLGITSLVGSLALLACRLIGLVGFTICLVLVTALIAAKTKLLLWLEHAASHGVAALRMSASKIVNAATTYYAASSLHVHTFVREKMCWWLALAKKKMWLWIAFFGESYDGDV
jgi:hypothetical protein